ncbi:NACHT domain-containing protein [Micromonospora sp. RP3T]|uniref:NACHT domain-containing protein n=1 Tax=Micromonospora sp. RP3T TaxID=2135446 RepID=UPI003D721E24
MRLPLTYRSALKLIGAHEPVLLTRLDKLLGGMVLASGVAGLPMGSAVLTAVWGWVDQKSEFVKLLTGGVTWCRDRLAGASGHERRQLVAAAHTVLVGEALFHALQTHLGSAYRRLELTDEEKKHLFRDKHDAQRYSDAVAVLLDTAIEVPWAGRTFDENLADSVEPYLRDAISRCLRSFGKLAVWERAWTAYPRPDVNAILRTALGRYEENYFRLATDVPEFLVWALLGEQRGASLAVRAANREIVTALRSQAHSLHKVEALLSLISGTGGRDPDTTALRKLNESILDQPLISASELMGVAEVAIPTIRDGYVAPRFRCALVDSYSYPSSEQWWSTHRVRSDLDTFLAAYLASAECTQRPLVVLGHPGAGKSLLTRVLTARLSATAFPAFLVPLRRIRDPGASIYQQIQQILDESTHARALWSKIGNTGADGAGGATRVVLLDGLDELMQATGTTESGYLSQVQEFQRVEATQDAPVAVILTSRQVVADIANIPPGCMVIRIEDFTEPQISAWLDAWNRANASRPAADAAHLSVDAVLEAGELARQPLLLLMIAIQATTSGRFAIAASETTVYHRLLVDFTRRELRKDRSHDRYTEPPAEGLVQAELWRLGVAAYGMFNRGQQFVTEDQLQEDLGLLDPRGERAGREAGRFVRPLTAARRTIGRFFFIHTSETGEVDHRRKTYEFLHATFAEYLMAHHAVDRIRELIESYESYRAGRLRPEASWNDDEILYSLLAHRPMAASEKTVEFVRQIFDTFDPLERVNGGTVLENLLSEAHRHRAGGREVGYNPGARSGFQRLAAYLTNLIVLRLLLLPDQSIRIDELAPDQDHPLAWWQSTVRLIQAGLGEGAWFGVLRTIEPVATDGQCVLRLRQDDLLPMGRDVYEAQLLFDPDAVDVAYVGVALWRGLHVPTTARTSAQLYSDVVAHRLYAPPSPGGARGLLEHVRTVNGLTGPTALALVEYLLAHGAYLTLAELRDLTGAATTPRSPAARDVTAARTAAVRAVPLVVARPELLHVLPQLDHWYGEKFPSSLDFLRVGGALKLLALTGSPQGRDAGWKQFKTCVLANSRWASSLSFEIVEKYAALASAADVWPAIVPSVVDAMTFDLANHARAGALTPRRPGSTADDPPTGPPPDPEHAEADDTPT